MNMPLSESMYYGKQALEATYLGRDVSLVLLVAYSGNGRQGGDLATASYFADPRPVIVRFAVRVRPFSDV
jgi:hypothetical protein